MSIKHFILSKPTLKSCYLRIVKLYWLVLGTYFPKRLATIKYRKYLGRDINWNAPQDLNEKINWLKFYGNTSEWSRLSDKYEVRKYIEEKGLGSILVPLYGVWSNPCDIDFEKLPNSFVLKSNHASGTIILVKDKSQLDILSTINTMKQWLKRKYGILTAEPHYSLIEPKIIAEQYLVNDQEISSSLIDYKIFCFDGNPYCILVCANRIIGKGTQMAFYDLNWNLIPDMLYGSHEYDTISIPKPKNLDNMLNIARALAEGHPQVRVDLYESNDKVYFGELTFTSMGGYMSCINPEYLLKMGDQISIQ